MVDDVAYDEWEEDTEPTTLDPDVKRDSQDVIDEVLRDAEGNDLRDDGSGGNDEPQST